MKKIDYIDCTYIYRYKNLQLYKPKINVMTKSSRTVPKAGSIQLYVLTKMKQYVCLKHSRTEQVQSERLLYVSHFCKS